MILVVGGVKGGVGKSTIAANLVAIRAAAGRSVLLADADTQGTSQMWAAARAESKLAAAALTTVALSGRAIRDELLRLAQRFDDVIVDAGARDTVTQRAALTAADMLLAPFQPRGPALWTLPDLAATLAEIRTVNPTMAARVFVNLADANPRVTDNADAEAALAEYADALTLAPCRVVMRKAIADAHVQGLAAFEARPADPKAVAELAALAAFVFGEKP